MSKTMIQKLLDIIPVFSTSSWYYKLIFSAILVIIFMLLCIPSSKSNKYIENMNEFSPVKEAKALYEKDGPRAASEYITFYQSLPNYRANNELNGIKEEAERQRSEWGYMAKEMGRGILGMEHHEDYAHTASEVAGNIPYLTDARDILAHGKGILDNWKKFQNNENVDSLQLGIDGVGLVASLCGLLPGVGHAADPVKKSTGVLRKCVGIMKTQVKDYVLMLFKNVFAYIDKSGILNIRMTDFNNLSSLVEAKKSQFLEAMNLTNSALQNLYPLINCAFGNWDAASIVLENATNAEELNDYLNIVTEFDKSNKDILRFGGANALKAAVRLQKAGKFNIEVIKNAMAYGAPGLEAVGHIPARDFSTFPLKSEKSLGVARIIILVIFGLYALLALIKIWQPENRRV